MDTGVVAPDQPTTSPQEAPPFVRLAGNDGGGLVIVCDHAGNRVPPEFGDLGLPAAELARHIAYDPGAAAVARRLAEELDAPAILANFSRLLIDANRGEDDPTLIMKVSDGTIVPGNAAVDGEEHARRIARYHAPYHAAIDAAIDRAVAAGRPPALVSIHSFTPVWRDYRRPWHAGVLWDSDARLAGPMIEALRADATLVIGDNEPYSGALANDTMQRHGTVRGLAHALVEIRQDLIGDEAGAGRWATRLADILATLNRAPEIHDIRHFASRAD